MKNEHWTNFIFAILLHQGLVTGEYSDTVLLECVCAFITLPEKVDLLFHVLLKGNTKRSVYVLYKYEHENCFGTIKMKS
jgi:hypothetical protein